MFHFTIRDLLWLTVLSAVAVAWWIDRSRLAKELERWKPAEITVEVELKKP